MLAALGVYQEGVAKNVVNGKPVVSSVRPHNHMCCIAQSVSESRPHMCTSTQRNVSHSSPVPLQLIALLIFRLV